MSCPTCGHTMARVTADNSGDVFHCERCGTLTAERHDGITDVYRPKLVDRCREYEQDGWADGDEWRKRGIPESIHKPEDRT